MSTKFVAKLARFAAVAVVMLCGTTPACTVDEAPSGLRRTPPGPGARVRYDMFHKPLPDIPLPNDIATWPDPSSRTGLRINASLVAPTEIERTAREKFSEMEGWGTYAPLSLSFDGDGTDPDRAVIDLSNVQRRHQGDDYDLADDTIYLVNLRTGIPVPIDIGEGSFNYIIRDKNKYWPNDTRRSEENLLFETYDETAKAPGATEYRPELDTDFDGVLDRPNLDRMDACPPPPDDPDDPDQLARDQCIADHLLTWYERETDSLIFRPVIPLDEMTQYAVVVSDRLLDSDGNSVKSPFEFIYHPMQERAIARLQQLMSDESLAAYYGDIGGTGLDHVAFAWAFTTQPVFEDLRVLRDGLYGVGPFAHLSGAFPLDLKLLPAVGLFTQEDVDDGANPDSWKTATSCEKVRDHVSIVRFDEHEDMVIQMAQEALGIRGKELDALVESFEFVDYIAIGSFTSPFFIQGGPKGTDPNATFRLNFQNGRGEIHSDSVTFWLVVPKPRGTSQPPFPVNFYGHGYTSAGFEAFIYAGNQARQGLATVGVNAVAHSLNLNDDENTLIDLVLKGACLGPLADAIRAGRARDLNRDGQFDSGGDFWTSYIFHTRDVVRQSVVDHMQMIRFLRMFDGTTMGLDYDGDGALNLAGDFNADGTVDIGGPDVAYTAWGESLGGVLSGVLGGVDHNLIAAAPTCGGGGLADIGIRSFQGGVVEAVVLRLLGPLLVGVPTGDSPDPERTSCAPGQISVRWVVPDLNETEEVEVSCVETDVLPPTGGTVVVKNIINGQTRCARADSAGRFRVGIPASFGDNIFVELHSVPDNVKSYGTCEVVDPSKRATVISRWGSKLIESGEMDEHERLLCGDPDGCVRFQGLSYGVGDPLSAPAEGYGYIRQTPQMRRFIGLAQAAIDPADPINFAPYFAIKGLPDPSGNIVPAHGALVLNTIGDMNVPVSTGIAYGRAAGALPFLAPDAVEKYPALVDYITPTSLYEALGNRTPNRVLIDSHVVEGIHRLGRHPAGDSCRANELDDPSCHPACAPIDPEGQCYPGQDCVEGVCQTLIGDPLRCDNALFDPDDLDEGRARYAQQRPNPPLRLARVSANATVENLNQVWAPRLNGVPHASTNDGAWDGSRRITALLNAYIVPEGRHCFEAPNPCQSWDFAQYLVNLTTRYFATEGRDLYYLTNPASHQCLMNSSCVFFE